MDAEAKPSPVERFKEESQFLRGEIPDELVDGTDHFGKSSVQLLKHHGMYQQDDRDVRGSSAIGGGGKSYMMMVRTRIPGGILNSDQMLAELDLCDELGNATLRVTTRQALQLHGVLKSNVKQVVQRVHDVQLTTLGACGDVNRNIMCCPAPYDSAIYQETQQMARQLADHLAPRTPAYHEIWLQDSPDAEKQLVAGGPPVVEPLYGTTYLPRKFKAAISFCHDNCVDVYTHDLGLLAIVRDERIVGYNVLVGGGQGVTPSAKKTFPALAKRLGFVTPDQVAEVTKAIIRVQRDNGNRSDRKTARLKYLIHRWGMDRFRSAVETELGCQLGLPKDDDVHGFDDHLGWHTQGAGRWFYGLNIENGRIADTEQSQLKAAIREVCETLRPGIRLTSHQSILFTDLTDDEREPFVETLRKHRVVMSEDISTVRRWSMACVAWPTCGLAITESERALPGLIDQLEPELAKLGLAKEAFTIRMTGCPNGCARPYNSDIGLVGRGRNKYTVFLGGQLLGRRLNFIHKDLVPTDEVVPTLVPIFACFKAERLADETFGDFCNRMGNDRLTEWADEYRRRQV